MAFIGYYAEDMSGAIVSAAGNPTTLISDFASNFSTQSGIPADQMVFWFNNVTLDPSHTIGSYEVPAGGNLTVLISPLITSVTRGQDTITVSWRAPVSTTGMSVTYARGGNNYPFGTNVLGFEVTASSASGNLSCSVSNISTISENHCTIANTLDTSSYSVVVTALDPGTMPNLSSPAVESSATATLPTTTTTSVPQASLASTGTDITPFVGAGPGLMLLGASVLYGVKRLRRSMAR
jgi:hypothetical protein